MPTIKLTPSVWYNYAGTSYLTITDGDNAFTDVSSTTYATLHNINNSTSNRYVYLQGFNFGAIDSSWEVESFSIKIRGYESGLSTSTSTTYRPRLAHGTTTITDSTTVNFGTSVKTITFSGYSLDWDTLKSYGSDFGIRVNVRRSNSSTDGYLYIYGAEIEVTYSVPVSRTITTSLNGDGTISPSGVTSTYDGADFTLTITPTNKLDTVTATNNGVDITSELIGHGGGTTTSTDDVLGSYTLISGGFNGSGASHFQGLVGKGVNSSTTTSNYYSSGSSTIAVFTYNLHFTVPNNAIINRVYCQVNGHAESTSSSNEYMCVQLRSGDVDLCEELNFKSVGTSNTTKTLEATTLPTVAQLASMVLQCRLGYYGGALNGATCYVEYEIPGEHPNYYIYSYTVNSDATIVVTIGGAAPTNYIYVKINGSWIQANTVYKKISGSWVQQTDLTSVFDVNTNYVKGNT